MNFEKNETKKESFKEVEKMAQTENSVTAYDVEDWKNKGRTQMSPAERESWLNYKMSRPNVQKILYKNVQLVCLS